MPVRWRFRLALLTSAAIILSACGGSTPTGAGSPSPTQAASPTPPPSPTPVTYDGYWSGSTSTGDDFSFNVREDQVFNVTIPEMDCGAGFPSTIESGVHFEGDRFTVESPGLVYSIYPEGGGPGTNAQDETTVKGTFTSGTTAKGTIVLKVRTDQGVEDSCRKSWTATKG